MLTTNDSIKIIKENRKLLRKRSFLNTTHAFPKVAYQRKNNDAKKEKIYEEKIRFKKADFVAIKEIIIFGLVFFMVLIIGYFVYQMF